MDIVGMSVSKDYDFGHSMSLRVVDIFRGLRTVAVHAQFGGATEVDVNFVRYVVEEVVDEV